MKRLLIIVIVLMQVALNVNAQSVKSDSLFALGIDLYNEGKYQVAIPIFKKCISLDNEEPYRTRLSPPNKRWEYSIMWLASCYYQLGDSTMADSFFYNYIDSIIDKDYLFPVDRRKTTKSDSLIYVGELLYDNANYEAALNNFREGMNLEKNILGESHPWYKKTISRYADMLFHIAGYNSKIGNPFKAIGLCKDGLLIKEYVCGKEHRDYAIGKNNLASYYADQGNYDDAINESIEAISLIEGIWGKEDPIYATAINNLAGYYYKQGYLIEAIQECLRAFKIRIKSGNIDDQLHSLGWLAFYYSSVDDYESAIQTCKLALQIIKRREHDNDIINELLEDPIRKDTIYDGFVVFNPSNYKFFLKMMAYYNYRAGNLPALEEYSLPSYEIGRYIINSTFRDLTDDERNFFWKKYDAEFLIFPHLYSYKYPTERLIKCSYNASLLSKGLLLNLSRSMSELIQSSGDQEALSLYSSLRLNRMTLQKQYEKPKTERTLDTDSLEALTAGMERELIKKSKIFGDYTKDMSIQWEDVQQKLGKNDIAIEFVDFPIVGTDSTMYVALTLKKEYNCPHMIPLFEKRQLTNISKKDIYCNTDMYNLVWQPLEEELTGVKNIYFSPSGELHRIAIEYVPVTATDNISDRYEIRRLSSTRQLATIIDEAMGEKSVVYGGLEYDAIVSDTIMRVSSGQKRDFAYVPYVNVDSLKLRSSYKYLPGSKEEADSIVALLSSQAIPYTYFCDNVGTEESFKHLDGTKPKLLHIATHGFYWTEEDAKQHDFRFLLMNERKPLREDKAMTRSGLLLSGCNRALKHETIPEQIEDGILTAEEISKLDLRGLDLVVLSACKTGLGDIISGEGVFGLQRGFKKAGAKTILMSLWKVDDLVTQMLMKEFYKNYCSGKVDKRESLRLAQKAVREYKDHNGKPIFKPPYYWAGFIMLD